MPSPQSPLPAKKAASRKQVAEWQSWEKRGQDRKFLLIIATLGGLAVAIVGAVFLILHKSPVEVSTVAADARPTLINAKPPELLQPFICDTRSGFRPGKIRVFLKNTGNSRAIDVTPTFSLHVVRERPVGIPAFDQIPDGNCADRVLGFPSAGPLAAGAESSALLAEQAVTLPPIFNGEAFQLYALSCIYYGDGSRDRGVCDTYRFRPADGTAAFMCDAMPRTGKFDIASITNCAN
jgi:hypothetical protein